jgi:tetratricopeptide (TPR) repeat protein
MRRWLALAAASALLSAQGLDPDLRDGLVALNIGEVDMARMFLESAAAKDPGDPRAWLGLAETYFKQTRHDQAREAARKAESLRGKNALLADSALLHGLAMYSHEAGRTTDAVKYSVEALQLKDPRFRPDERFYVKVGQALLRAENFAPAIDLLNASRFALPKSAQLELMLGVAHYGQRRFEDAVDSLLRVIAIDPDIPQPYVFLARLLPQAARRMMELQHIYQAYASRHPDSWQALYCYALMSSGDEAEQFLRRSIALDGNHAESHFELGLLLERKRLLAEAAASIERSVELAPRHPSAWYRLARIYDRLKQPQKSAAAYARHQEIQQAQLSVMDKHDAGMSLENYTEGKR